MTQCDCTLLPPGLRLRLGGLQPQLQPGAHLRAAGQVGYLHQISTVIYTSISRYLLSYLLMILLLQILWKVGRKGAAPVSQPSSVRHQGPGPHKPSYDSQYCQYAACRDVACLQADHLLRVHCNMTVTLVIIVKSSQSVLRPRCHWFHWEIKPVNSLKDSNILDTILYGRHSKYFLVVGKR